MIKNTEGKPPMSCSSALRYTEPSGTMYTHAHSSRSRQVEQHEFDLIASCTASTHVQTTVSSTHKVKEALRGMAASLVQATSVAGTPHTMQRALVRRHAATFPRLSVSRCSQQYLAPPYCKLSSFEAQREQLRPHVVRGGPAAGTDLAASIGHAELARADGRARRARYFAQQYLPVKRSILGYSISNTEQRVLCVSNLKLGVR